MIASTHVGPMPGTPPWAGIVGAQQATRFVICGHEYHEAAPLAVEAGLACDCGTFAIGRCAECSRAICGTHSKVVDGRRLCEADVAAHDAHLQALQRLDDLRGSKHAEEAMRERLIARLRSLPSEPHRAAARAAANETPGYGYSIERWSRDYGCVASDVRERAWFPELPESDQQDAISRWNEFVMVADALCGGPFGSMNPPWRDAQHLTDWFFEQLPAEPNARYKFRYPRHLKDNGWPKLPKRAPGMTIRSQSDADGGTRTTWLTTDALVIYASFNWDFKEAWVQTPVRELAASDIAHIGMTLKLGPSARRF